MIFLELLYANKYCAGKNNDVLKITIIFDTDRTPGNLGRLAGAHARQYFPNCACDPHGALGVAQRNAAQSNQIRSGGAPLTYTISIKRERAAARRAGLFESLSSGLQL